MKCPECGKKMVIGDVQDITMLGFYPDAHICHSCKLFKTTPFPIIPSVENGYKQIW